MQLYLSGLQICDLFVYSPIGSLLVTVHRDESFIETEVTRCEEFFFKYYLSASICKENCDTNNNTNTNNMELSEGEVASIQGQK